jgi:endonuclease/exonuclease/phosphatase family metal-dependent hydrolase
VTIRVASYNVRGLADDRAAAAQVVRAIDPDVLLLQEVPWHPLSSYRVSAFARACGLLWSGRTWILSATAVMTSIRVIATDAVDRALPVRGHPGRRLGNQRGYTTCRVHRPGGEPVSVTSIHLSLDADERVDHTRRLLAGLAEDPRLGAGPHVVGGDLNETVDGAAWGLLGEGLRVVTPEQATFPAARPQHWIDAIFASSDVPVAPHQDVGLDGGVLTRATDHLPVWVDLDV